MSLKRQTSKLQSTGSESNGKALSGLLERRTSSEAVPTNSNSSERASRSSKSHASPVSSQNPTHSSPRRTGRSSIRQSASSPRPPCDNASASSLRPPCAQASSLQPTEDSLHRVERGSIDARDDVPKWIQDTDSHSGEREKESWQKEAAQRGEKAAIRTQQMAQDKADKSFAAALNTHKERGNPTPNREAKAGGKSKTDELQERVRKAREKKLAEEEKKQQEILEIVLEKQDNEKNEKLHGMCVNLNQHIDSLHQQMVGWHVQSQDEVTGEEFTTTTSEIEHQQMIEQQAVVQKFIKAHDKSVPELEMALTLNLENSSNLMISMKKDLNEAESELRQAEAEVPEDLNAQVADIKELQHMMDRLNRTKQVIFERSSADVYKDELAKQEEEMKEYRKMMELKMAELKNEIASRPAVSPTSPRRGPRQGTPAGAPSAPGSPVSNATAQPNSVTISEEEMMAMKEMKTDMKRQQMELERLREKVKSSEESQNRYESEAFKSKKMIQDLENQMSEQEAGFKRRLNKAIQDVSGPEAKATLDAMIKEKDDKIAEYEREVVEYQGRASLNERKIAELEATITATQKDLDGAEERLASARAANATSCSVKDAMSKQEAAESSIKNLKDRLNTFKAKMEELVAENASMKNDVEEKKALDSQLALIKEQLAKAEEERDTVLSEKQAQQLMVKMDQKRLAAAKAKVDELESTQKNLKIELQRLKTLATASDAERQAAAQAGPVKADTPPPPSETDPDIEEQMADLRIQLDTTVAELSMMARTRDQLDKDLRGKEKELQETQLKCENLQSWSDTLTKAKGRLEGQLQATKEKLEAAKEKLAAQAEEEAQEEQEPEDDTKDMEEDLEMEEQLDMKAAELAQTKLSGQSEMEQMRLENNLRQEQARTAHLQSQLDSLQTTHEKLVAEEQLKQSALLKATVQQKELALKEATMRIEALEEDLRASQQARDQVELELISVNGQKKEATAKLQETEFALKIAKLSSEEGAEEAQAALAKEEAKLREEKAALEAEKLRQQEEMAALMRKTAEEREAAQKKLNLERQNALAEMQMQKKRMTEEMDEEKRREMEKQHREMENQHKQAMKELNAQRQLEMEKLHQAKLDAAKNQDSNLMAALELQKKKLEEEMANQRAAMLNEARRDAAEAAEALQTQLADVEDKTKQAVDDLTQLEKDSKKEAEKVRREVMGQNEEMTEKLMELLNTATQHADEWGDKFSSGEDEETDQEDGKGRSEEDEEYEEGDVVGDKEGDADVVKNQQRRKKKEDGKATDMSRLEEATIKTAGEVLDYRRMKKFGKKRAKLLHQAVALLDDAVQGKTSYAELQPLELDLEEAADQMGAEGFDEGSIESMREMAKMLHSFSKIEDQLNSQGEDVKARALAREQEAAREYDNKMTAKLQKLMQERDEAKQEAFDTAEQAAETFRKVREEAKRLQLELVAARNQGVFATSSKEKEELKLKIAKQETQIDRLRETISQLRRQLTHMSQEGTGRQSAVHVSKRLKAKGTFCIAGVAAPDKPDEQAYPLVSATVMRQPERSENAVAADKALEKLLQVGSDDMQVRLYQAQEALERVLTRVQWVVQHRSEVEIRFSHALQTHQREKEQAQFAAEGLPTTTQEIANRENFLSQRRAPISAAFPPAVKKIPALSSKGQNFGAGFRPMLHQRLQDELSQVCEDTKIPPQLLENARSDARADMAKDLQDARVTIWTPEYTNLNPWTSRGSWAPISPSSTAPKASWKTEVFSETAIFTKEDFGTPREGHRTVRVAGLPSKRHKQSAPTDASDLIRDAGDFEALSHHRQRIKQARVKLPDLAATHTLGFKGTEHIEGPPRMMSTARHCIRPQHLVKGSRGASRYGHSMPLQPWCAGNGSQTERGPRIAHEFTPRPPDARVHRSAGSLSEVRSGTAYRQEAKLARAQVQVPTFGSSLQRRITSTVMLSSTRCDFG